jgi:hypothetical protein
MYFEMRNHNNSLHRSCIHWYDSPTPPYCYNNTIGERQRSLREDHWKHNFLGIICLDWAAFSSITILLRLAGKIRK